MKIATFGLIPMIRRWIPINRSACVYAVAYKAWLNFTAGTCVSKSRQEDYDALCPHIKHVYRQVYVTNSYRVHKDSKLPKADDTEAIVSTPVYNDVRRYQPTTSKIEMDDKLLPQLKVFLGSH